MLRLRPAAETSDVLGGDKYDARTRPAPPSDSPSRCRFLGGVCVTRRRSGGRGYSRWRDRSLHLCFKTVRATFAAHGSSVRCPVSEVSIWLSPTAQRTCDPTFRASPLRASLPRAYTRVLAPF